MTRHSSESCRWWFGGTFNGRKRNWKLRMKLNLVSIFKMCELVCISVKAPLALLDMGFQMWICALISHPLIIFPILTMNAGAIILKLRAMLESPVENFQCGWVNHGLVFSCSISFLLCSHPDILQQTILQTKFGWLGPRWMKEICLRYCQFFPNALQLHPCITFSNGAGVLGVWFFAHVMA